MRDCSLFYGRTRAGDGLMYRRWGKRAMDVVVAAVALVLVSPLLLLLVAFVRWRLGRPALFRQPRAGLHGCIFILAKLRTMTKADGADGSVVSDADRLTPLGRVLRRTSLDELPELWNILRGDMSLVGPRPLLVRYLPRYSREQARRHEVRPGLTGWAQVNGRNALSWGEKFRYDVWYVDNLSLTLDLRILFSTIRSVLRSDGISADSHVTMHEFMGNGS